MREPSTLLLVPIDPGVALTSACLGLLRSIDTLGLKAGFLQAVCQAPAGDDSAQRTRTLVSTSLGLDSPEPVPYHILENLVHRGDGDAMLELVVERHAHIAQPLDGHAPAIIVVEGLRPGLQASYALDVNAQLASALNAQVILVADGHTASPQQLIERLRLHRQRIDAYGTHYTQGVMLMRLPQTGEENTSERPQPKMAEAASESDAKSLQQHWQQQVASLTGQPLPLIAAVPYLASLSAPRTQDVAKALGARLLHEGDAHQRRVTGTALCARNAEHLLYALRPGMLIVTPADRDDTILATALAARNGVQLAGLLFTHGETPSDALIDFCRPALESGLPVLSVATDSYTTVAQLKDMPNHIPADDPDRAESVAHYVASHCDLDWLAQCVQHDVPRRLSPAAFRHKLVSMAQYQRRRIVLPEGNEPRTLEAAILCQNRGIADCVLLGKRQDIMEVAATRGLELPKELTILDPDEERSRFIAPMVERRKGKLNELTAEDQLQDSVVLGTMMLAEGEVDGLVSGAIHTTANTVRPAFQLIKSAPGYRQVSSVFFMLLPEQVVVYGDCAVNPDPDAETLAEIALQSAASAQAFGIEPRVAMISYSTGVSGSGADVDKVREATRIAKERAPHLAIDGPLQYDAAAIASVGQQKAPGSPVAGRATVFVFPDLNTGNTTYKAVQRSARVVSIGPMLQGLNKPVNDLSRGALVDDIVYTIALTAIQASQRADAHSGTAPSA
ncbi:phosphate acetyltransferase [Halomonas binhaiensis]|uniref:Phosphate acetyltransferase n=2 Tax=Halomonas binhaiensis TaxID=2562282 RepID=A0A856QR88_9GAMM|nr:phosphate acetyltransferase [Halomonas binhaiensis]